MDAMKIFLLVIAVVSIAASLWYYYKSEKNKKIIEEIKNMISNVKKITPSEIDIANELETILSNMSHKNHEKETLEKINKETIALEGSLEAKDKELTEYKAAKDKELAEYKITVEAKEKEILILKESVETKGKELSDVKISLKTKSKDKISAINTIAKEVNQSLELNTILNDALEKVLEASEVEAGIILLTTDEDTKDLKPVAFRGISDDLVEELRNITLKSDEGTRGKAIHLGKAVIAEETSSLSKFTGSLVKKGSFKSIVSVPLTSKKNIIGLLEVGSRSAERFSDEDLNLLNAIGNQIGIAVQNAKLYSLVKEQVKELEDKNSRLIELEGMKNNLTQMIVHDLKNPLTGIMGHTQLLLMDKDLKEDNIYSTKMIFASSKNLFRMIMNLLDVSRMEENKIELAKKTISIEEIINENVEEIKSVAIKEKKFIIKNVEENLPMVNADSDFIYRVIANLMNNALNYSLSNGKITVGARSSHPHDLVIFVSDEGEGIPAEYKEKIFEKFVQVDAKKSGMRSSRGLGLTFCKMAVEAHGGKIWFESELNKGSTFYFSLPVE